VNQARSTIWICLSAALATLASAASVVAHNPDTETVDVEIEVQEYIILSIGESSLSWDVGSLDDSEASTLEGTNTATARATFNVEANADYYLTVTVTNTWNPSNLLPTGATSNVYARLEASGSNDFIAGTVFLDDDVSTVQSSGDFTGITFWDLTNGQVQTSAYGREKRQWGLGATFIVQYVGNSSNPSGVSGKIALEDTYSTTATITAALD